jgi:hypothetical protein
MIILVCLHRDLQKGVEGKRVKGQEGYKSPRPVTVKLAIV